MRYLLIVVVLLALLMYVRGAHAAGAAGTTWGDGTATPFALIKAHPGDLSDQRGDAVKAAPLTARKYLFLYYSAGWCPPCHAFTPVLCAFDRAHSTKRDFDIVLVSNDQSADGLAAYAREFDMPFAMADYGSPLHRQLLEAVRDRGIPNLLLFDASGKLLASSYKDGGYIGPQAVLDVYNSL